MDSSTTVSKGIPVVLTEASFENLFKRNFRELMIYAHTLLNDQVMAEEAVQQVFFKVWEKRERLSFDTSVKAYLYKAIYHHCLNLRKHQKVRQEHVKHALHSETGHVRGEDISSKEMALRIQEAINSLPEQCRLIFQMSRFEELKYREIADRLKISVKTVEAQMGKALKQLRNLLGEYINAILVLFSYIINHH